VYFKDCHSCRCISYLQALLAQDNNNVQRLSLESSFICYSTGNFVGIVKLKCYYAELVNVFRKHDYSVR